MTHAKARAFVLGLAGASVSIAAPVAVPGTANIYLAGEPEGTAYCNDTPATASPTLVAPLPAAGASLTFTATGSVCYAGTGCAALGPDGNPAEFAGLCTFCGVRAGFAGVCAPVNALIGVFLGPEAPSGANPPILSFGTPESRDFASLSPVVGQPFFIGDGRTSGGVTQTFVVPPGAARLYLGTMDGSGWFNNTGAFSVEVGGLPGSCRADWNGDGVVGAADITAYLSAFFADRAVAPPGVGADYNADGVTSAADITAFLGGWFDARANGC